MTAPDDSPYPWHVRLGAYRFGVLPYTTIPQWLADGWTAVMQEAIEAWARGDDMQPDFDYVDNLSDEMVAKRMEGFQTGYNKEWTRRNVTDSWHDFGSVPQERYVFADMPLSLQRAVVSRWDALHNEWIAEHVDAHYAPDFGYYWRVTVDGVTVKIKMWEHMDGSKPPTQENSEGWERRGFPGGILGYYYPHTRTGPEENTRWLYVEGVPKPDMTRGQ